MILSLWNFEKYFGIIIRSVLRLVNLVKKHVVNTECEVHQFINIHAIKSLKKHNYKKAFLLFFKYQEKINQGVVWADQDFKSIGHFYNFNKDKGLYGHDHSLNLLKKYYKKAFDCWLKKKPEDSMFYLGACVHLLQDMTVPHHVNIRLLDKHRKYENYVKANYQKYPEFINTKKPIIFDSLVDYIKFNAKNALDIYQNAGEKKNREEKFYYITKNILPLAQRTTAGCFLMFAKQIGYI